MADPIKPLVSPWKPMQDPLDLKCLGKLLEELNECGSAAARCIIQGIHESEPVTGKPNKAQLEEEIADVTATISLVVERYKLDLDFIMNRAQKKREQLLSWHGME